MDDKSTQSETRKIDLDALIERFHQELDATHTDDVPCTKVMSSQSASNEVCDKNFTDKRIQEHNTAEGSMTASSHQGYSLIEAKSMSESLLKANERVYPVSRLDMITKLKGMKKQRDAKLDKRGRSVYMMTNYVMPFFKQRVNETVAFAKLIPGFRDLHIGDQMSLMKGSVFECSSISGYTYDSASGIFYADDGTPLDKTDLELVKGFQEIVIKRLEFTLYVESLSMTPLEESVIRALTIFTPLIDGCKLIEQEKVFKIFDQLTRCLSYVISLYHSDPAFRAEQMITLLKKCYETEKLSEDLLVIHVEKE